MRIACYFNGRSAFGGAERRLGRIMNEIAKENNEVVFVFTLFDETLNQVVAAYKKVISDNCVINFVGFNSSYDVYKFMKQKQFDVVFYTGAYRHMLPFFLGAKRSKSKTVMLLVSTEPSIGKFSSLFQKIEYEFVAKHSDIIDCLYPSATDSIRKKYKRQIVTTTPCPGTDLERFQPKEKRKVISFLSRWVSGKNVELFLESVISIEEQLFKKGYTVYLCGKSRDGFEEEQVKKLLSKAKHPEIIVCPGYVDSYAILSESEVFVSVQSINNYPSQSLLEAISCGCYIIASDEGDTRLLVKEEFGNCCNLNKESISNSISNYIGMSEEQKRLIPKLAHQFALNNFKIHQSVSHYLRLLDACRD